MIKSFLAIVLEKLVQIRLNNLTDSYLRTVVSEVPTHRSDALLEFKKHSVFWQLQPQQKSQAYLQ